MSESLHEVAARRLDAFVDASFAFALTLLVISGSRPLETYADLDMALGRVPAFAAGFALLALFWSAHRRFGRMTAARDGAITLISLMIVFTVMIYVFPLRLLTETGASTGAIQIAGTDSDHQLPFFVTTCDYTLIGEELYAASAYLSREPVQLGTLRGQDIGKAMILSVIVMGILLATLGVATQATWPQYFLDFFRDVK